MSKENPGFTYLPKSACEWLECINMECAVVATRYGGGFIAIVSMSTAFDCFDFDEGEEPSLSSFCDALNYEYKTHEAMMFLQERYKDEAIAYCRDSDPMLAFQNAMQKWLEWNQQPGLVEPKAQLSNKERVYCLYRRMMDIMKEPIDISDKYDKIFSPECSCKILELVDHTFEWWDPDTSCSEDVSAFIKAVREWLL